MMVRLSNCGSCHHGIVTMSCRPQQAYIEREICLALWKGLSCCKRSPWKLKFQPHSTRVTLENFLLLWCIGHGRPWEAIAKVFDLSYLLSTQALSPSLITYCLGKVCGIKMQVIENNMGHMEIHTTDDFMSPCGQLVWNPSHQMTDLAKLRRKSWGLQLL